MLDQIERLEAETYPLSEEEMRSILTIAAVLESLGGTQVQEKIEQEQAKGTNDPATNLGRGRSTTWYLREAIFRYLVLRGFIETSNGGQTCTLPAPDPDSYAPMDFILSRRQDGPGFILELRPLVRD